MASPASKIAERRQALARAEQTLGPQHPTTISAREQLGYAYQDAKLPELAVPLLEQVIQELDRSVGPLHRRTIIARKNLANSYHLSLRIGEAIGLYRQAAGQAAGVFGPLHLVTLLSRSGVAACLLEMRQFGEAIAEYDRVLPDWVRGFGPAHPQFLMNRWRLAHAWDGAGHMAEAMTQYWRLLGDCERALGPDDALTRRLAGNIVPAPRPWHSSERLGTHRLWLVSLSAIQLARAHGTSLYTVYPHAWLDRHQAQTSLNNDWEIRSREKLLPVLQDLAETGHREQCAASIGHPPLSWDFARYASMVRNAFCAEYIDEPQAWQLLEGIVGSIAEAYTSWRDFAEDYLAGRRVWVGPDTGEPHDYPASQQQTANAVSRLLDPASTWSPWNLVPWDAIRRPDQPAGYGGNG